MVLLADNVGGWADTMISLGQVGRFDETLPWSFLLRVGYSAAPEFGGNEATITSGSQLFTAM